MQKHYTTQLSIILIYPLCTIKDLVKNEKKVNKETGLSKY